MKNRKHTVAALSGGLVCLLMTGCHKEELVTPSGVAVNNSASATNGIVAGSTDPASTTVPYEQWTIDDAVPVPPQAFLNGRWSLYSLHGRLFKVAVSDVPWLVVRLHESGGGHGTLNGSGGCNRIGGTAFQEGSRLSFTDLGRTKMYCAAIHDLEEEFFDVLRGTNRFEEQGGQLRLLAGNTELAVLLREYQVSPEEAVR